MRCIYTEKVCSWEVVGPMGGEFAEGGGYVIGAVERGKKGV